MASVSETSSGNSSEEKENALKVFCSSHIRLQRCQIAYRQDYGNQSNAKYAEAEEARQACLAWIQSQLPHSNDRCWRVRWGSPGDDEYDHPLYLRWKHSSAMGALTVEGIKLAVAQLTKQHLAAAFERLASKKKPCNELCVWQNAIEELIRLQHVTESDSMTLDYVAERHNKKSPPFKDVPPELVPYCKQWHRAKQFLNELSSKKTVAEAPFLEEIKRVEQDVKQQLESASSSSGIQSKQMVFPIIDIDTPRQVSISVVDEIPDKKVRITAFKPLITKSLQQCIAPDSDWRKVELTESFKQQLVTALTSKYYTLDAQNHRPVSKVEFVTL